MLTVVGVAAALLATAAVALAATAIKGARYVGRTSEKGPATLQVSKSGRALVSASFINPGRKCTRGDFLPGEVFVMGIPISAAGTFDGRITNAAIRSPSGKKNGTATLTIAGRFGSGGRSVAGKVTESQIRFNNGGTCRSFSFTYTAATAAHHVVRHHRHRHHRHPPPTTRPRFTG